MKPSITSLRSRIREMIQNDLLQTPPEFHDESSLFELGMDSMAIMQFLLLLEEEFQLSIPVESVSLENFKSVKSVAHLLAEKLGVEHLSDTPASNAKILEKDTPFQVESLGFDPSAEGVNEGTFDTRDLQGTDLFVCGFERYNQKRGLRGHWAYTVLELTGVPELEPLQALCAWLPARFKILNAAVTPAKWFRPSKFQSTTHEALPLIYWYPSGQKPSADPVFRESAFDARAEDDYVKAVLDELIHSRVSRSQGFPEHVNFDVIVKPDGTSVFVMSWNHLIFDGVGAEEFLIEVQRYWAGRKDNPIPAYGDAKVALKPWSKRYEGAKPMLDSFRQLIGQRYACLGEVAFQEQQRVDFEVVTLSREQTLEMKERVAKACGGLVTMPYYLACVMRAHEAVQRVRNEGAFDMLTSVPVQVRKKGASGPIFQNQLTMFYVRVSQEQCRTLEAVVEEIRAQHARFVKENLGDSFSDMMDLMRFVPPVVNMNLILKQMKGVLSSFYHSNTGVFAKGMDQFLGCRLANAYHIPGIGGPPGTGVFFSECQNRITVVTCWIEGSFRNGEREIFREALWRDLGVNSSASNLG